ncbi:flagellar basal body-associated FliL family protein [Sulfitobacter sp. M85]|nr:flagellar basal body-associated FliL family protein [Sulfitobacter sp. Ks11]MDF3386643.1 flagellar basal body-associated FliL family protein [Sulfitobacter sp. M85]MDF3390062.1 flagellar basal body-associated FliL family protein [Sulfitobacter sp. Ks16]MDF3400699.1 flagellar basal body-associated FliL family protein [Sulfitobacter sp. KE39]MDF3404120.1 flagellar basal body-associated FliL family protein [Sulfitobacter sp. Ks35]MDF3411198.1 flagellar basal body-associated FliL family protein
MWRFARDPIKSERMKKPLAILAVVLLCLLAGLGGVTLAIGPSGLLEMAGLGGEETAEETVETAENDHGEKGGEDGHGAKPKTEVKMPVMPFPEIIVNVTDTGPQGGQTSRFLKLNMLMVYDETAEGADRLVAREIYLRDSFQDFLRQLHVSDLSGSYGLAMLKTELLRRARAVGHTDAPHEILIADMVVQ